MTSNAMNEQHVRGWKELPPMPQGARWRHGCCVIDDHCMIILGGEDDNGNALSSISSMTRGPNSQRPCQTIFQKLVVVSALLPQNFICTSLDAVANKLYMYIIGGLDADGRAVNARTEQSSPLPNNMPAALYGFSAVANERYIYVIGGRGADYRAVNTMYRLSLETYEWTTLAPMGTARCGCAGVLLDDYIYIFGGYDGGDLASAERYSIVGNSWEGLPDMAAARCGHCAVAALRNKINILGGYSTRILEVFDTALLEWKTEARLCDMPDSRIGAAAVELKNRYLVVIGGRDEDYGATAGCLIYDCLINQWSSTPASMNMITARYNHTAALLDGKIVVAGGWGGRQRLSSVEWIDARDVLEYAPLDYPLPQIYFDQILQLGKALLVSKHT